MAQLLPLDRRFHLCSHCRWFILLEKVNRLEVFTPLCVDGGIPKIEERSILGKPRLFLVKEQAEGTLWEIVRVSWPIILTCGPSLHMNTTATGTGTVLLKLSMMCFHFFTASTPSSTAATTSSTVLVKPCAKKPVLIVTNGLNALVITPKEQISLKPPGQSSIGPIANVESLELLLLWVRTRTLS